jgi:hypothetical protein
MADPQSVRASRAFWSPAELAVLQSHIDERDWLPKVMPKLRDRGEQAVRCRMAKLRAAEGMSDSRGSWMRDAARGSAALLVAIANAGVRP